jgi:cytoplasmic iron level regulating protein YaaA (DUF328/UPF0246 family)
MQPQNQTVKYTIPDFLDYSAQLIDILKHLKPDDLQELMHINNNLAQLNTERHITWHLPFNQANAKQAILAFNGEVYRGLDAYTFTENELIIAQQKIRILSGLYGILKPLDLIQPYRLEMGIPLNNPSGKNLYQFWKTLVTNRLNEELSLSKSKILVNLASEEYFKVIDIQSINENIINPVFMEDKNGKLKTITIYAKKARGMMSKFIVKHNIDEVEYLKAFDEEGYCFTEDLSTKNKWVFVR